MEIVQRLILGSEHTDLFGLTDAKKTPSSYEDFHNGFHASLCV